MLCCRREIAWTRSVVLTDARAGSRGRTEMQWMQQHHDPRCPGGGPRSVGLLSVRGWTGNKPWWLLDGSLRGTVSASIQFDGDDRD